MTAEPLISFPAMMLGGLAILLLAGLIAELMVKFDDKKAHAMRQHHHEQINNTYQYYSIKKAK